VLIDIHYQKCSYWCMLKMLFLLMYFIKCLLIEVHYKACSDWCSLLFLYRYTIRCVLIDIHNRVCSFSCALLSLYWMTYLFQHVHIWRMCSEWHKISIICELLYITKCVLINVHYLECSDWHMLLSVFWLTYVIDRVLIDIRNWACSDWHTLLIVFWLTNVIEPVLIDIRYWACSDWHTLLSVFWLTYIIERVLIYIRYQECSDWQSSPQCLGQPGPPRVVRTRTPVTQLHCQAQTAAGCGGTLKKSHDSFDMLKLWTYTHGGPSFSVVILIYDSSSHP